MTRAILFALLWSCAAFAHDPLTNWHDPRFGDCPVTRDDNGRITRSYAARRDYVKEVPCPANGSRNVNDGCPGWAIDHSWPRACGGVDAPFNMSWMPDTIKSCPDDDCKDRWERKVYGGHGCSVGCP